MRRVTIQLSEAQYQFLASEVKDMGSKSLSAYLSHLVLKEQLSPYRERIDALLREGLSEPDTPLTEADLQEIEREGLAKLAEEKRNARKIAKRRQSSKRSA